MLQKKDYQQRYQQHQQKLMLQKKDYQQQQQRIPITPTKTNVTKEGITTTHKTNVTKEGLPTTPTKLMLQKKE